MLFNTPTSHMSSFHQLESQKHIHISTAFISIKDKAYSTTEGGKNEKRNSWEISVYILHFLTNRFDWCHESSTDCEKSLQESGPTKNYYTQYIYNL